MKNPLEKLDLKTWPDVLLAIFVIPFTIAFTALLPEASRDFAIPIVLITSGMLFFGLAGKISYYRFRDNTIKGNSNAWFSGWRHSILGNSLALVGVAQILLGFILLFMGTR